jgi:peptide deformylase
MSDHKTEIVQVKAKVLREKTKAVPLSKIKDREIKKILKDMQKALEKEEDGVAIAAPQIGISKKIFIVSPRAFEQGLTEASEEEHKKERVRILATEHLVYINPMMVKLSRERKYVEEGCLSIRWLYGKVKRATRATIKARDENGKEFTRGASGLLAQIFQHETDHLDGVLFIDNAKNVRDVPPTALQGREGIRIQK